VRCARLKTRLPVVVFDVLVLKIVVKNSGREKFSENAVEISKTNIFLSAISDAQVNLSFINLNILPNSSIFTFVAHDVYFHKI
jgi:hypothetical protein